MIKITFKKQLLLLICCVLVFGCITSCKKDNTSTSSKVELLSFGPSGAQHGDTVSFIGKNLNKVTGIVMIGDSVMASNFVMQTPELIKIIIPQKAEEGTVILRTTDGPLVSKTLLDFTVTVSITSITPQARPGDNITITGNYVNWITSVIFNNGIIVKTFVSKSVTSLVVQVPQNAQSGVLSYTTGGFVPLSIDNDTHSNLTVILPLITAMAPNPVLHGTNLTITGTNLDLTKGVLFNGSAAAVTTFVSQSATQIVVKVPPDANPGTVNLVAYSGLMTPSLASLALTLPAITTLAPVPVDHSANLTITGTNLNLVTGILFKGNATAVTTFVSQSATQIVVKVPAVANKGKITLQVLNSTLTVDSPTSVLFIGDLPDLAPLAYAIYEDNLVGNWQNWGWSTTCDFTNTDNVRDGTASIKLEYTGQWGALKFANGSVSMAPYTELAFSIFGTPGTDGLIIHVQPTGGNNVPITIQEGKWVEFHLTKAQLGNPGTITDIMFQCESWTGTVYMDHVGFR
jgi:hypothetical protein